ncbi:MAG: FeoB-associated Cys-rich membrane protein [Lachnospiraceae bacterium]|nr:FeoB-associated Cys-rich membrane protein [Lachnospiraceae bacterium]
MAAWISENLGTIIVTIILVAAVAGIIYKLIKDKRQGKSCCGGSCTQCKACGRCPGQDP